MAFSVGELTAITVGLGNIAAWSKIIYDARKNGKGENGKTCPVHAIVVSQLSTLETEKEGLSKELGVLHKENREEHQKLSADIKGLSVTVAQLRGK